MAVLEEVVEGTNDELKVVVEALNPTDTAFQTSRPARRRSSVTKPPTKTKAPKKSLQHQKLVAAVEAHTNASVLHDNIPKSMLAGRPLPLLICSIGNPGAQYANTFHSAGHTVLNRLAERLGYPQFHRDKTYGNGLVSKPSLEGSNGEWTLWQSTSYMNDSGKGVRAAYMAWSKNIPEGVGRLVIVHDELEKPLGAVSLRTLQGASAKGHNGLKSIKAVIGNTPFFRIGIGIGRPVSRASDDVARYVLQKMSPAEKAGIDACVDQVIDKLRQLEEG